MDEDLKRAHELMDRLDATGHMQTLMVMAEAEGIPPSAFVFCMIEMCAFTCAYLGAARSVDTLTKIFRTLLEDAVKEKAR